MAEYVDFVVALIQTLAGESLATSFGITAEFAPSLFSLLLLFYVFIVGLMLVSGMKYTLNNFLVQILLFILLYAFATQYGTIAQVMYNLLVGWTNDFVTARNLSLGFSFSSIISRTVSFITLVADQFSFGLESIAFLLLSIVILIPTIILMGILFMTYIQVFILSAIVIGILPIMFIFGMFSATRDMLMSTLRLIMQYLVLGLLAIIVINFTSILATTASSELIRGLATRVPLVNAAGFGLIVYSLLLVSFQLPSMAASIAGGLAANVGGLATTAALAVSGLVAGAYKNLSTRQTGQHRGTNRITRNNQGQLRGGKRIESGINRLRNLTSKSKSR